jgi:hypothetical protein
MLSRGVCRDSVVQPSQAGLLRANLISKDQFLLLEPNAAKKPTSRKAEKLHQDALRKMTFAQKWEQVWVLRETAWRLKAAGIKSLHPDWSESQVQDAVKKVFLYGST